jgi:hypothetical protein
LKKIILNWWTEESDLWQLKYKYSEEKGAITCSLRIRGMFNINLNTKQYHEKSEQTALKPRIESIREYKD